VSHRLFATGRPFSFRNYYGMQPLTVGLDVIGGVSIIVGVLASYNAQQRLKSADARRTTLQTRLEETERRLRELEEKPGKRGAAEAGATKAAVPTVAVEASRTTPQLETANRRIADLEKELSRLEAERRRTEAEFEKRLKEALDSGARRPTAPVASPVEAPAAAPMALPRPKSLQTAAASAAKTPLDLLFASGDAALSSSLTPHLTEAGYSLHPAGSMTEVLQLARDTKPAIIVLDSQFGKRGADGFATLTALKKDEALRDIPVVLICPVKDREHANELGAASCVAPPVTPNVLLGSLSAAIVAHKKRTERSRLAKAAKSSALSASAAE